MDANPARRQTHEDGYIQLADLRKEYRTNAAPLEAIRTVSAHIGAQEFVSLIGPSGCGKSTLLFIIAGLERPTAGVVRIGGRAVSGPAPDVGIVFQRDLLLEWATCLDNILLQFRMRGIRPTAAHRRRARDLLDLVGLSEFAEARPGELSGGMRQRVAICRALVHGPSLLLMDEPFGALDALTREQLNIELGQIARQSEATVVLVTHSIEEAVFLSDRVLVMSPRPSRVVNDVRIPLPRPRDASIRDDPVFVKCVAELREHLVLHNDGLTLRRTDLNPSQPE